MSQAARQYDWDEQDLKQFNQSQTEKIISIRKERLAREQVKRANRSKIKMHLCTLTIVLAFAFVVGHVIYQNSIINEAKYDIFNLKSEIKTLTAKTEELQVKIEEQTDLSTIEQIATEKLGMQYPTKEQTVYIDEQYRYTVKEIPESAPVAALEETKSSGIAGIIGAIVSGLFD
ncbi:cell division protein FtsL [Fusibacter sp. JL298sf-3]